MAATSLVKEKEMKFEPLPLSHRRMAEAQDRMQMLIRKSIMQKPALDKEGYESRVLIRKWRELHSRDYIDYKYQQPFRLIENYFNINSNKTPFQP